MLILSETHRSGYVSTKMFSVSHIKAKKQNKYESLR